MSDSIAVRPCRCGQIVIILNTQRGKKIAVNREPKGHDAFRFRDVERNETYYVHGQHQPHMHTCTKKDVPRPRDPKRRYV